MHMKTAISTLALAGLIATPATATNGYFQHGIGQKSMGMGGVGIALPQDTFAAGHNPAGMILVGDRMDVGLTWFRPSREAEIKGSPIGGIWDGKFDGDGTENFLMPEFGYNRMVREDLSFGVAVYGNGGMNTDYDDGIRAFNGAASFPSDTGIDMGQIYVVPTVAFQFNERHAIGVGLNLVGQYMRIEGLQNFDSAAFSSAPGKVTNNGHDYSFGVGVRLGWIGEISDRLTVGATYASKTSMSDLDDYEGILADGGNFDIPENYGLGLAFKATDDLTLAFDLVEIKYSDIDSIANGGPTTNLNWRPMGTSQGAGFGWDDQTVYKLGIAWQATPEWTLRAGYNHGESVISSNQTLLNILAPATVKDHLTLGATWALDNDRELSFHYMHAFEEKIKGRGSMQPAAPLPEGINFGEADIKMSQNALGVGYSWIF